MDYDSNDYDEYLNRSFIIRENFVSDKFRGLTIIFYLLKGIGMTLMVVYFGKGDTTLVTCKRFEMDQT